VQIAKTPKRATLTQQPYSIFKAEATSSTPRSPKGRQAEEDAAAAMAMVVVAMAMAAVAAATVPS
jgi:hypothetical protein